MRVVFVVSECRVCACPWSSSRSRFVRPSSRVFTYLQSYIETRNVPRQPRTSNPAADWADDWNLYSLVSVTLLLFTFSSFTKQLEGRNT